MQKLKQFDKLFQDLVEDSKRFIRDNLGDFPVQCTVHDSVYCRSFELKTFYEFNDYEFIDLGNLDFMVEFDAVDNGRFVHRIGGFRLTSYPGVSNVFCVMSIAYHKKEALLPVINIAEFLSQTLYAKQTILHSTFSTTAEKQLVNAGWDRLFATERSSGGTNIFLTKSH